MKQAFAKLKNLGIAPRKVRLVTDVIRGMHVNRAIAELQVINVRSAKAVEKLLKSAISNAKNLKMDTNKLFIKTILVNQGPMLKRFLPRARGSATEIQKKFSHVLITLAESEKIKAPNYLIIEKPKKSKVVKEKTPKQKPAKEVEEKIGGQKRGFMQKMFNRKAV